MDFQREENLTDFWLNYWTEAKKNSIAKQVNNPKFLSFFFKSFVISNNNLVIFNQTHGFGNFNKLTYTIFIDNFFKNIDLTNKNIIVLQNLKNPSFYYDLTCSKITQNKGFAYIAENKKRTSIIFLNTYIKRIRADYIIHASTEKDYTYIRIFENGKPIAKSILINTLNEYNKAQTVQAVISDERFVHINQNLIEEDYIENSIKNLSGSFLYDEPLINIVIERNNEHFDDTLKKLLKLSKYKILFTPSNGSNFLKKFINYIYIYWIKKPDIILKLNNNFNQISLKLNIDDSYAKIDPNFLVISYLDYYINELKAEDMSYLFLDPSFNAYFDKLFLRFPKIKQVSNLDDSKLFLVKDFANIGIKQYKNDIVAFIFKYILYINYLKNQNISMFFKWKNLTKLYGNYYELVKVFNIKFREIDKLLDSIKNNFSAYECEYIIEVQNITSAFHDQLILIRIPNENSTILIAYNFIFEKYEVYFTINKDFKKDKSNYKKRIKKYVEVVQTSLEEAI
ncbi:hypothetical protein [Mycoplasma phocimorsus]|uniref:hypothetical protein n=1 Tax=Mycoplasma phocimorsus TaxID=3045839 RepID=UPI0024BFB95E|nr:hypothetical protein [Mycoplasma phocimorsus]MDJ1646448.1 hypothetical protein [Mycoplasma phocimorsus]